MKTHKAGKIRKPDKGKLFLDETGEFPLALEKDAEQTPFHACELQQCKRVSRPGLKACYS